MLNMGYLIVIGDVEVFNTQWFLYNASLSPFFKFRQRQRIFINFRQRREASINTVKRRFKIQMSDMGSPLAGPLDSDWRFYSLCGSHLQSQSKLYHVSWWYYHCLINSAFVWYEECRLMLVINRSSPPTRENCANLNFGLLAKAKQFLKLLLSYPVQLFFHNTYWV